MTWNTCKTWDSMRCNIVAMFSSNGVAIYILMESGNLHTYDGNAFGDDHKVNASNDS